MEEQVKNGAPVNSKSLLAFIFNQMDRLNRGEIDANTACASAKLANEAGKRFEYELKRTLVQIKLRELGGEFENIKPRLREIESKAFDDTI